MKLAQMKGFTLVEVMITVGILAVVAAIAVPAYTGYIETGRLTEGWNNLYALNAAEQQYFLENNAYFSGTSDGATNTLETNGGNLWVRAEATGSENFKYVIAPASVTATGYTATATGKNKVKSTVVLTCVIASGKAACTKS